MMEVLILYSFLVRITPLEFGSHFSVERNSGEVGIEIDSPSAKFHIKQDE